MAHESGDLKPEAQFELYTLRLGEVERQAFIDQPESRLRELLKKGGAPDPNEVVVLRARSDEVNFIIDAIVESVEGGGSSSHPPVVAVLHEVSGPHPSKYITIIAPGD